MGTVVSIKDFGAFLEFAPGKEGLVHISGLGDYYEYDKDRNRLVGAAGGRVYALGDAVRVRVERVNVPLGEINFELLPPKAEPEPGD